MTDASKGLVSVVIPVRNAAETIADQLAALAVQDYPGRFEVVVAANDCTDATLERVAGWEGTVPGLRAVDATGPRCTAFPRNVGTRAAAGELILICDADDIAEPQWVAEMVKGLEEWDVVTGPLVETTLNQVWQYDFYEPRPQTELPVAYGHLPYPPGGNMGIRRNVLEALGGFDVDFGGAEDMDFGWRALAAGYKIGFVPGAVIHYRLPRRARDFLGRRIRRCSYLPLLYRRHRASGMGRDPVWRTFLHYAGLVAMAGRVATGRGAPYALAYWGAERIGRIVGTIRYRTFFI